MGTRAAVKEICRVSYKTLLSSLAIAEGKSVCWSATASDILSKEFSSRKLWAKSMAKEIRWTAHKIFHWRLGEARRENFGRTSSASVADSCKTNLHKQERRH